MKVYGVVGYRGWNAFSFSLFFKESLSLHCRSQKSLKLLFSVLEIKTKTLSTLGKWLYPSD